MKKNNEKKTNAKKVKQLIGRCILPANKAFKDKTKYSRKAKHKEQPQNHD